RVLRPGRARLRVVLAVQGSDRKAVRRPGGAAARRGAGRLVSRIDVAFVPAKPDAASVAVVIDVLRATTTIAYALAQGYERVLACGDLDQARELARRVNGGAVLAGERACVKPEGFDLGNSPREFEGP